MHIVFVSVHVCLIKAEVMAAMQHCRIIPQLFHSIITIQALTRLFPHSSIPLKTKLMGVFQLFEPKTDVISMNQSWTPNCMTNFNT